MNVFNRHRQSKKRKRNTTDDKTDSKDQFNIIIEINIKEAVQNMGKVLRVNQSVMSEHLLEVGLHHTNSTIKDPDKRKLLEKHMEISHLLNEDDQDEEVVIRTTENNHNWILLDYTKHLSIRINKITQTMQKAGKMQDVDLFNRAEKQLNREMAKFANWVLELRGDEEYDDYPEYRR